MTTADRLYLRDEPAKLLPAPVTSTGVLGWMRANLFSSPLNIALTVLCVGAVVWIVPDLLRFFLFNAVWSGADREACLPSPEHPISHGLSPLKLKEEYYYNMRFRTPDDRRKSILSFGDDTEVGQGGTYLVVDDPDAHHSRSVAAGAEIVRELRDEDFGLSRGYAAKDPEGHVWVIGTYQPGTMHTTG